jgi:hypothetical protein
LPINTADACSSVRWVGLTLGIYLVYIRQKTCETVWIVPHLTVRISLRHTLVILCYWVTQVTLKVTTTLVLLTTAIS